MNSKQYRKFSIGLFAILFLCFHLTLMAQPRYQGYLEIKGRTVKDNQNLPGAIITVYKGHSKIKQVKSNKRGKFDLNLPFGDTYKITFSAASCVNMYMMVYANIPVKKRNIYPIYGINVPFFSPDNQQVDVKKFKHPFTKVVFDGKGTFKDDDAYLKEFASGIFATHNESADAQKKAQQLALMEKQREQHRRDSITNAAAKAARQKEQQHINDSIANVAAEKKALEEAKAEQIAAMEAHIADSTTKAIADRKAREAMREQEMSDSIKKVQEAMAEKKSSQPAIESDAIKMKKAQAKKEAQQKKNSAIRSQFENNLLKTAAQNERNGDEEKLKQQKSRAEAEATVNKVNEEANVKVSSSRIKEDQQQYETKELANRQLQSKQFKELVKSVALAEREINMDSVKYLPDVASFKLHPKPEVSVQTTEEFLKTVTNIDVKEDTQTTVYSKETYIWGSIYYYKNSIEITEQDFNKAISAYNIPVQQQ